MYTKYFIVRHPTANFRATKTLSFDNVNFTSGNVIDLGNDLPSVRIESIFLQPHMHEYNCVILNGKKYTKGKCKEIFFDNDWNVYG